MGNAKKAEFLIMQNHSDEELVALYKESSDPQFLTALFTRHSDIVYRSAMRIMKNASDAEDVMQTSYIKMIRDLRLFKGTGSVLGWMLQVVINTCYQHKNSEKSRFNREKIIMSERPSTTNPKNSELSETIETHLNKLPEIYKVPITLQIMEGLSIKEVSQALSIPEKTIRSQIARGLEKLKVSLQNVGITASVLTIGDVLKGIPMPLAPEVLKSNSYFQTIFQSNSGVSAKIAMGYSSKNTIFSKIIMLLGVLGISIAGYFYIKAPEIRTQLPINVASKNWNFEDTRDITKYQDINLVYGGITLVEGMGVNKTKGLVIDSNTLLEVNVSNLKWPLRISYQLDMLVANSSAGQIVFKKKYVKDKHLMFASELRPRIIVTNQDESSNSYLGSIGYIGNWMNMSNYVSENSVEQLVEGKIGQIFFGTSEEKSSIYLHFSGNSIIDNLKIESIDVTELPDKSKIEKEISSVKIQDNVFYYKLDKTKIDIPYDDNAMPSMRLYDPGQFERTMVGNTLPIPPRLGQTNSVEWSKPREKRYKKWLFESSDSLKDIKVLQGAIAVVNKTGINKSSVLEISPNTILEFDISEYELPIRFTQMYDVKLPDNAKSNGVLLIKNNYDVQKNIFNFANLNEAKLINTSLQAKKNKNENVKEGYFGQWFERVDYISNECIDSWTFGERSAVFYGTSYDNKKIIFVAFDQTIIDQIVIESIASTDLPDVSAYKTYANKSPFKQGAKSYSIKSELLNLTKEASPKLSVFDKYSLEKGIKEIKAPIIEKSPK